MIQTLKGRTSCKTKLLAYVPQRLETTEHLHGLPIEFRIEFKILLFVFEALNGMAPCHISDLIRKKSSARSSLRSNDYALLDVPRTRFKTLPMLGHRCGKSFLRLLEWLQMLTLKKKKQTVKDVLALKGLWHLVTIFS